MRGKNRTWKPEDDIQLEQLRATGMQWSVVAKKLNKTEAATISRAGVLAIRRLRQREDLPAASEPIRRLLELVLEAKR
jgi:hypothetical protein